MRKFDYLFLKTEPIPADIASSLARIEKNKIISNIFQDSYPKVFDNLAKIAKVQSVKSSNEIEGIVSTDLRIKSIVNEETEPLNHNEQEIAGYRDVLNMIHRAHDSIDVSTNEVLMMHKNLLARTKSPEAGIYKTSNNVIVERFKDGTSRVRYRPTEAKDTPEAMEQLTLSFYQGRQESSINPLLLIPCYILDFLCIHPFADGNGRMSRLLTLLLLYKEGYDVGKYVSLENIINNYKDFYYRDLQESSTGWDENKNDYWPFVRNFLFVLDEAYIELAKRYEIIKGKKLSKAERIEETIKQTLGHISKEEIHEIWPDISITTIELELSKLVKEEKIEKVGNTNGVCYFWKH